MGCPSLARQLASDSDVLRRQIASQCILAEISRTILMRCMPISAPEDLAAASPDVYVLESAYVGSPTPGRIEGRSTHSGKSATSPAIVAAEAHFQTPAERHEKGSGLDIIAAQRDVVIAKTARLKAARMAQEAVQAEIDAEARRTAPPKLTKKRVPKA